MNNFFKKISSRFAVLSAVFITVVPYNIRDHQSCDPKELLHCTKPLQVLTDSGLSFVSSKSELDKVCPDLKAALKCIHGYARHCMSMDERQHFKKLYYGTGLIVMELCTNGTYQTDYLKHVPCIKRAAQQNETCMKAYMAALEEVKSRISIETTPVPDLVSYQKRKREATDEAIIKNLCCSFQQYVECSTHTMRRACGEEAAEVSKNFLGTMSSGLIQLHCREYGPRECGLISSSNNSAPNIVSAALRQIGILGTLFLPPSSLSN